MVTTAYQRMQNSHKNLAKLMMLAFLELAQLDDVMRRDLLHVGMTDNVVKVFATLQPETPSAFAHLLQDGLHSNMKNVLDVNALTLVLQLLALFAKLKQ